MRRQMVGDRGSATVLAVAVIATLAVLGGAVATVGDVLVARRRAASVADLAALAGAQAARGGAVDGCPVAAALTAAFGARMLSCNQLAGDVTVDVGVDVRGLTRGAGSPHMARARAKAGPRSAS